MRPVVLEISDERLVARIPREVGVVRSSKTTIVGAELVDDVERLVRWSLDRYGVAEGIRTPDPLTARNGAVGSMN